MIKFTPIVLIILWVFVGITISGMDINKPISMILFFSIGLLLSFLILLPYHEEYD